MPYPNTESERSSRSDRRERSLSPPQQRRGRRGRSKLERSVRFSSTVQILSSPLHREESDPSKLRRFVRFASRVQILSSPQHREERESSEFERSVRFARRERTPSPQQYREERDNKLESKLTLPPLYKERDSDKSFLKSGRRERTQSLPKSIGRTGRTSTEDASVCGSDQRIRRTSEESPPEHGRRRPLTAKGGRTPLEHSADTKGRLQTESPSEYGRRRPLTAIGGRRRPLTSKGGRSPPLEHSADTKGRLQTESPSEYGRRRPLTAIGGRTPLEHSVDTKGRSQTESPSEYGRRRPLTTIGGRRPLTARGGRTQTLERRADNKGRLRTTSETAGSKERRAVSTDTWVSGRTPRFPTPVDARTTAAVRPQTASIGRPLTTKSISLPRLTSANYTTHWDMYKEPLAEFIRLSLSSAASDIKQHTRLKAIKAQPTPAPGSACNLQQLLPPKCIPSAGNPNEIYIGTLPKNVGKFEHGGYSPKRMVSGSFEKTPYAEGRYRLVFKGVYESPVHKQGNGCILKMEKSLSIRSTSDYKTTLQIHKLAKRLAEEFNKERISPKTLEYVDIDACIVEAAKYLGGPENYAYLIEDFIPGNFMKWCNNFGYVSDDSTTLPAFMHWTFIRTKGRMMVGDLQGVRTNVGYILTDPAIMSNTYNHFYGKTDTGAEGIALFFKNHRCSRMCLRLQKPYLHRMLALLPGKIQDYVDKLEKSAVRTHELLLTHQNEHELIEFFDKFAEKLYKRK